MDGFRWDYPLKAKTPNLNKIAASGVRADKIIPSFPTKTFPNHYTLATGLYPDHHGIVLNEFYDPERKVFYNVGERQTVEDGNFYEGEPAWVTAESQGLKSAALFWVGSEAVIKGIMPSIWK
jgi:alkaline phosphatase D